MPFCAGNEIFSDLDVHNNLTYNNLHRTECKILNKNCLIIEADTRNQNVQHGLKRASSAF